MLDVLEAQQRERFMAMVLVTHDLGVVAGRADDVIVMYAGQVVEKAPTATLFGDMKMPYTEALLRSIPKIAEPSHTRLAAIPGRPPDLVYPPAGCQFADRCAYVQDKCREEQPPLFAAPRPATSTAAGSRSAPPRARPRSSATAPASRGSRLMAGTGTAHLRDGDDALLRVEDLVVEFPAGGGKVNAVSGISLDISRARRSGSSASPAAGSRRPGGRSCSSRRPRRAACRFERHRAHRTEGRATCARCARGCR